MSLPKGNRMTQMLEKLMCLLTGKPVLTYDPSTSTLELKDSGGKSASVVIPAGEGGSVDISGKENTSNKKTTLTNNNTDYPTTKAVTTELDKKVSSVLTGEPAGATAIKNMVSLTQAQYDAGTKVATTLYVITDA